MNRDLKLAISASLSAGNIIMKYYRDDYEIEEKGYHNPVTTADNEAGKGSIGGKLAKTDFSKLKMILDVPLKISVELGRTKMLVNDLLQLGQGSVVELDKIAGEPMEILINDKLVAMGEVVVVNEKFGVRLTDVISQFGLGDLGEEEAS